MARVAQAIYPRPHPPTFTGVQRRALLGVLLVLGAVLSLARTPRSQWNVLWAEDGTIFASGALNDSWASLIAPYSGYFHLVPRVAAFAVAWVPLEVLPVAITFVAAVITAALAVLCYIMLESRIAAVPLRLAAWLVCIVLPTMGGEVPNNLANLHWYLLITAVCVLLTASTSRRIAIVQAIAIFAAITSDALGLLLIPLFVVRWWLLPSGRDRGVVGAALAAGVVQACAVVGGLLGASDARQIGQTHPSIIEFGETYSIRVALTGLTGVSGSQHAWSLLGQAAGWSALLAVVALLVAAARVDRLRRWGIVLFFAGSLASAVVIYYVQWYAIADAPTEAVLVGMRYAVVPAALMMIAVLIAVDAFVARVPATVSRRNLAGGVLALVLIPMLVDLRAATPRQDHWPWRSAIAHAREWCADQPNADAVANLGASPTWFGGMLVNCAVLKTHA
ncbi:hypothetical protein [Microbacterium sp.]|uniref:hypothetical protein n=1 Tax=Microbacterium sp. TaxID=51671 RepID=UPI0039E51EF2